MRGPHVVETVTRGARATRLCLSWVAGALNPHLHPTCLVKKQEQTWVQKFAAVLMDDSGSISDGQGLARSRTHPAPALC